MRDESSSDFDVFGSLVVELLTSVIDVSPKLIACAVAIIVILSAEWLVVRDLTTKLIYQFPKLKRSIAHI